MTNELGYVQVAAWNDIIMVLPEARDGNCYSVDVDESGDANYNNRNGLQIAAVKAMMDRVLDTHDNTVDYATLDIIDDFDSASYEDYADKDGGDEPFNFWDWLLSLFGLGGSSDDDKDGEWEDKDGEKDDDYDWSGDKSGWEDWDGSWDEWDK